MTLFAIIGLLFIVVAFFVYISTILIGILIGVGINIYSLSLRDKCAPLWWNILNVIVTIASTSMLYKDIFNENIDYGPNPFIVLVLFGFVSLLIFFILSFTGNKNFPDKHSVYIRAKREAEVKNDSPAEKKEYDWERKEIWEDYPGPDYDDIHTYCKVAFDNSGKTFYYRTRNPELKVGDTVYVPVGYKYEKKVGTIVSMEDYVGWDAPYPLEKTKYIKGKVKE